eukprot:4105328-Lingulodinium_polyedra.AAC.1
MVDCLHRAREEVARRGDLVIPVWHMIQAKASLGDGAPGEDGCPTSIWRLLGMVAIFYLYKRFLAYASMKGGPRPEAWAK